ncbi:methyltransferase, FxLD system [Nucisporomicrobium flavum]|uniref:methyltransferase, FxLD system n=1 Tax=Nucisporomicrobium flavum TaxID=2785915 RepID=UPI0018F495BA|nr:methyltransferase, FxLD system [Nucisporomicrobium flavum]
MTDVVAGPITADLRAQLTTRLVAKGFAQSPSVRAAFRAVPRHLFAPAGTSLQAAYADRVVVTKRDAARAATSSVSAPWLQAYMLEQAQLRPGARVLEIGSGGYNAALAAELVGPAGQVTTIDIDPDVISSARAVLNRSGYPLVHTAVADGEHGYPPGAPYDAILVTVEAADVPPAWTEQLTPGGRLVVPLRMRAHTRCLTLDRAGDHLVARASIQCGFVSMQGHGQDPVRLVQLRGDAAVLILDDPATQVDATAIAMALDGPRTERWSPVTLTAGTSFEALHLFLASQPRPYGILNVDRERTLGLLDPQDRFFCPTLLAGDSLTYLTSRQQHDGAWQLGAHGFGPQAQSLADDLTGLLVTWDEQHRQNGGPQITVHPASTELADTDRLRLVVRRSHTLTAIDWPSIR